MASAIFVTVTSSAGGLLTSFIALRSNTAWPHQLLWHV